MADYTATTSQTLESCITNGSMANGENLTINSGAVITCDRKPSILLGDITINNGKLLIDGVNIATGNSINFIGEGGNPSYDQRIAVNGQGTLEVNGKWFNIGTTDGTNSQSIDLSNATGSDYWDGDNHIGWIPMIQVETGRRIDFDGATGTTPVVGDWIRKSTDESVMGKIKEVQSTYLIVWYLTGTLANNDEINVTKVTDNVGPDIQVT